MVKLRADDPLNLRAYRAVKNFNEKQRRVERSGKGYAPDRVSIKEIKSRSLKEHKSKELSKLCDSALTKARERNSWFAQYALAISSPFSLKR